MPQKLIELWNGGKKTFFSALAGALIGAIPVAVAVGEYKGKIDNIDVTLTRHVNEYTPTVFLDYQATKTKVDVQEEKICTLQRSLDEIKQQNTTIIKLMRSR